MKITYTLNKEDIINFSKFNYLRNKKMNFKKRFYFDISFMFLFFVIILNINWFNIFTFYCIVVYLIILILLKIYYDKLIIFYLKKSINKWNYESNYWDYEIEIIDDKLHIIGKDSETKISLNKIIEIIENEKYFYLYITSSSAYAINKNSVKWDKEEIFIFLKKHAEFLNKNKA